MTITARAQRLLPVARTIAWVPLLAGAALCIAAAILPPLLSHSSAMARWPGYGALGLCAGAAFLLDDPASNIVAATPTSLARRRLLRVALALPLLGAVWAASLWYATSAPNTAFGPQTRAGLCVQFAALLALTLAAAALVLRFMPGEQSGWIGAAIPFSLLGLALAMPERFPLLAFPGGEEWHTAQQHWIALLAIGLVAFAWSVCEPSAAVPLVHRRGR